jgi:hypothetical protein
MVVSSLDGLFEPFFGILMLKCKHKTSNIIQLLLKSIVFVGNYQAEYKIVICETFLLEQSHKDNFFLKTWYFHEKGTSIQPS